MKLLAFPKITSILLSNSFIFAMTIHTFQVWQPLTLQRASENSREPQRAPENPREPQLHKSQRAPESSRELQRAPDTPPQRASEIIQELLGASKGKPMLFISNHPLKAPREACTATTQIVVAMHLHLECSKHNYSFVKLVWGHALG